MTAAKSSAFVCGKPIVQTRVAARRVSAKRTSPVVAKYGEEGRFFDLSDLENTIGSWDMYGQDEKRRYNGLQSEFFERAAGGLNRREYLQGLVALGGVAILVWGAKGSKDANLPITKGPQKQAEVGPRGKL
ncbi:hypothetical protein Ndes2526B_g05470 [Nannochloris sp. 'desiccata']